MMTVQQRLRNKERPGYGSTAPTIHKALNGKGRTRVTWCSEGQEVPANWARSKMWHRSNCDGCAQRAGFRDVKHAHLTALARKS